MLKRSMYLVTVVLLILLSAPFSYATTISLDGKITDWTLAGNDLSVGGDGNFNNSWVMKSDVYGSVNNLQVGGAWPPPSGGELYDVEAMFMTSDASNIYVGIVTSFPKTGNLGYIPGDIGISLDSPGPDTPPTWGYEYGFVVNSHDSFTEGTLYAVSLWSSTPDEYDPDIIITGTALGNGSFIYTERTGLLGLPLENGYSTWVIEASIPKSYFTGLSGDPFGHWSITCGNDEGNASPVPEPATLLLVGSGCLGLSAFFRKTRKRLMKKGGVSQ